MKQIVEIDPDMVPGYYSDLDYIKFEDKLIENEREVQCCCLNRAEWWDFCYAVTTKTLKPNTKKRTTVWSVAGWFGE